MLEWLQAAWSTIWPYITVFLMAATPWLDVFLVVPLGIGWALNPWAVSALAFLGNWLPLLLLALFFREFSAWRARRKARKAARKAAGKTGAAAGSEPQGGETATAREGTDGIAVPAGAEPAADGGIDTSSKRYRRARRIWDKWGLPGLALVAPALLGTDLAALLALSLGSSRRWVMGWMTVSLLLWTAVMAVGSVYGFGYMGYFPDLGSAGS